MFCFRKALRFTVTRRQTEIEWKKVLKNRTDLCFHHSFLALLKLSMFVIMFPAIIKERSCQGPHALADGFNVTQDMFVMEIPTFGLRFKVNEHQL